MSFFHCSVTNISRGKGQSIADRVSYITGEHIRDGYTGRLYSHNTHQERILSTGIIAPSYAPSDVSQSPQSFVSSIDTAEGNSHTARTGKNEILALPNDATIEQCEDIVQKHIDDVYTKHGYVCLYAIHSNPKDPDNPNIHVHIIIQDRAIGEDGTYQQKRHKSIRTDPETGERMYKSNPDGTPQRYKDGKIKYIRDEEKQYLDKDEAVTDARKSAADRINEYLPPDRQVSALSYKHQRIDIIPTVHEGVKVHNAERKHAEAELDRQIAELNETGTAYFISPDPITDIGQLNKAIKERNKEILSLSAEKKNVISELSEIQTARATKERARQEALKEQKRPVNRLKRAYNKAKFQVIRIFHVIIGDEPESPPEPPKPTKKPENHTQNPMYKKSEPDHPIQTNSRVRTIDEVYGKATEIPPEKEYEGIDEKLNKAKEEAERRNKNRPFHEHEIDPPSR